MLSYRFTSSNIECRAKEEERGLKNVFAHKIEEFREAC
jgi:hypothetical protein